MTNVVNRLIETQEFATLPPVATHVLNMLEDDNVDIRKVSTIIETDPSLTLKLLRVANSPLYATRTEINSIQQAIITLGLNRLINIVLGVSIFSRFLMNTNKDVNVIMERFWWHSSCTGIVAKALSKKINKFFKESEFIGGLLHDIGKLAMIQYDSIKYLQVYDLIESKNYTDIEAEQELFETDHSEIGMNIAKLWKLPADLSDIISSHSHPGSLSSNIEVVAVVRSADILCEMWGAGIGEGLKTVSFKDEECWKVLCNSFPELLTLDMEVFTFELEEEFKKALAFLNLLIQEVN